MADSHTIPFNSALYEPLNQSEEEELDSHVTQSRQDLVSRPKIQFVILSIIIWIAIFGSWGVANIAVAVSDSNKCDHRWLKGGINMKVHMIIQGLYELAFCIFGVYQFVVFSKLTRLRPRPTIGFNKVDQALLIVLSTWIIVGVIVIFGRNVDCIDQTSLGKQAITSWVFSVVQWIMQVIMLFCI